MSRDTVCQGCQLFIALRKPHSITLDDPEIDNGGFGGGKEGGPELIYQT